MSVANYVLTEIDPEKSVVYVVNVAENADPYYVAAFYDYTILSLLQSHITTTVDDNNALVFSWLSDCTNTMDDNAPSYDVNSTLINQIVSLYIQNGYFDYDAFGSPAFTATKNTMVYIEGPTTHPLYSTGANAISITDMNTSVINIFGGIYVQLVFTFYAGNVVAYSQTSMILYNQSSEMFMWASSTPYWDPNSNILNDVILQYVATHFVQVMPDGAIVPVTNQNYSPQPVELSTTSPLHWFSRPLS